MLSRIRRCGSLAAPLLIAAFLCSCVPVFSIHPLYGDKDAYFDARLVGTWLDTTDSSQSPITFERSGTNAYVVSYDDNAVIPPAKYTYECHLVKLGDRVFIDAEQSDIHVAKGTVDILAIPGHMLGEVSFDGQTLTIRFLDEDWTQDALKGGMIAITHDTGDDGTPILTATTADLQNFVLAHADDAKAFSVVVGPLRRNK